MGDPAVRRITATQEQLMQSRRTSLRDELQAIDESIAGQQAQVKALAALIAGRREQLALLQDELGHTRELVREGYAPRYRQLELERNAAELGGAIAEAAGNATRTERLIAEQRQRASVRLQEYKKENEAQSADIEREVQADADKLSAFNDDLARTEIRSPASGQVVGLAVQTVGAVVAPGQKLMDIVPGAPSLLLEAHVAPHLIDRVHDDLPVDIRFASFTHSPLLVVSGRVASVSADLLTDARTGASYYLARVSLTSEGKKKLGRNRMTPGMPVEVVFITGERTLLAYWLHPLVKRLSASLKEP
jgi:protease secretion system membrane fusion protein